MYLMWSSTYQSLWQLQTGLTVDTRFGMKHSEYLVSFCIIQHDAVVLQFHFLLHFNFQWTWKLTLFTFLKSINKCENSNSNLVTGITKHLLCVYVMLVKIHLKKTNGKKIKPKTLSIKKKVMVIKQRKSEKNCTKNLPRFLALAKLKCRVP